MRTLVLLLALLAGWGCETRRADERPKESAVSAEAEKVLQSSKDPKELSPRACELARSTDAHDQEQLSKFLRSADFLNRLDTPEDYANTAARPRVGRVLKMLQENKSPPARQTLLALTQDGTFLKESARVDELIRATVAIRPAPPELVKFWDAYSQPMDSFAPRTIDTLCENASRPALDLLEKKLADPSHEADERISWMRWSILPRRNNLSLIECAERMLSGSLPEPLRPALVEVLFDYKPDEWYTPAVSVSPPDRAGRGPAARVALRRVAQYVLKSVTLTDEQKRAVENTLKELDQRQ